MKRIGTLISIAFLLSCSRKDLRRDAFSVAKVPEVSQQEHAVLQLRNRWQAKLIGVQATPAVLRYLTEEVDAKRVRFRFDSQRPQKTSPGRSEDQSFFAYVLLKDGRCLNSVLLQKKLSPLLLDYHLRDSLTVYQAYTPKREEKVPTPSPKRKASLLRGCKKTLGNLVAACDYLNPITRNYAADIAGKSPGPFNLGQVCELFQTNYQNWRYVNDPASGDYFATASETISNSNLSGDCDDFAVLMYSLVTAIGGEARITFAWGDRGGHAYTEVKVDGISNRELYRTIRRHFPAYQIDQLHLRGSWLNLDWWAQHPGGPYYDQNHSYIFYPRQEECTEQ